MWLESHGNLARHPKTRRLMQRMGWTLPTTIGNLHLLWWWALDFAPTGDLTHFEPEQLTYDLNLGGATPEDFIEAMVQSGFLDRVGDTLIIHDWPDYTSKSRRSRSCKSVSRETVQIDCDNIALATEQSASPSAVRDPKLVGLDLRAGRRISALGSSEAMSQATPNSDSATHNGDAMPKTAIAEQKPASNPEPNPAPAVAIPEVLASIPSFIDLWWPKFLAVYKTNGDPLSSSEQRQLLARLARVPFSAVQMLKNGVKDASNNVGPRELLNTS